MADKSMNNVEQIRELIFGPQLKEFEERFETLGERLKQIESKLAHSMSEAHDKLQKETTRALEALERKIDNLATATQKERTKLKEIIDTTDETLQVQLQNQKDEFATKLNILKENMEDAHTKTTQHLEKIRSEIEKELQSKAAALGEEKLSKDAMAGMLLDIAMKIQGTNMGALLSQEQDTEAK